MTAVLAPTSHRSSSRSASLGSPSAGAVAARTVSSAPALRVIEGGRSPRALARRRVFRQRRIAAAVVAMLLALVLVWVAAPVVASAADGIGGSFSPAAAGSPAAELPSEVVVAQGDTLWGISAALGTGMDTRVVVDELATANGGTDIHPGQRLVIPASLRG